MDFFCSVLKRHEKIEIIFYTVPFKNCSLLELTRVKTYSTTLNILHIYNFCPQWQIYRSCLFMLFTNWIVCSNFKVSTMISLDIYAPFWNQHESAFTHPVYAISKKIKRSAQNACINGMWQLDFFYQSRVRFYRFECWQLFWELRDKNKDHFWGLPISGFDPVLKLFPVRVKENRDAQVSENKCRKEMKLVW